MLKKIVFVVFVKFIYNLLVTHQKYILINLKKNNTSFKR